MAVAAGVAHQGAAQGAGDAGRELQARQARIQGAADQVVEIQAGADLDGVPRHVEAFGGDVEHQTPVARVVGEDVAAPAEHRMGQARFRGGFLEPVGIVGVTDRAKQAGGASHPQGRHFAERNVRPHAVLQLRWYQVGQSFGSQAAPLFFRASSIQCPSPGFGAKHRPGKAFRQPGLALADGARYILATAIARCGSPV